MTDRPKRSVGSKLGCAILISILLGLLYLAGTSNRSGMDNRIRMADTMNNIRQVKYALDGFAADNNGQFPNQATGESLGFSSLAYDSSNDYFRQLFLTGETQSEKIFWVRKSPVAGDAPDNRIRDGENFLLSEILKPGDVHWAYMTGQQSAPDSKRPLLMDPFKPGTSEFDDKLWNRKVLILTIDGSAKAIRMRHSDNKVVDGSGNDLLDPKADAWHGSGLNPRDLLVQPEPERKP